MAVVLLFSCSSLFAQCLVSGAQDSGRPACYNPQDSRVGQVCFGPNAAGQTAAGPVEADGTYWGVFRELPVGQVEPRGWLTELLGRQRDGIGRNHAASGLPFNSDLWVGENMMQIWPASMRKWPAYEQSAYLIDGVYRCGLLVNDDVLTGLAVSNINYVLDHPQRSGRLGPAGIGPLSADLIGLTEIQGGLPDTEWPLAVLTRAIMVYYDQTRAPRVLDALTRHYHSLPENFGVAPRDVNNIEGLCWLYGKTGDETLLRLAERTWSNAARGPNAQAQWTLEHLRSAGELKGHGVTVCEQSKLPALLFLATGRKEYLEASQGAFRSLERDHELVDGVVSSDEALHGKEAAGRHETCDIVDYTWGMGYMLQADGRPAWADKIERAVLNAGLGAISKDFRSHQYFSSPNQVIATDTSLAGAAHTGPGPFCQTYRPGFIPACCTGNLQRLFPNYVARMWMAGRGGGLAAMLYGPCVLRTAAGRERVPVTIRQETDYPFGGSVRLEVESAKPVEFLLSLRIPAWAQGASVSVNGKVLDERPVPGTFFRLERRFSSGDTVTLDLPMPVRMEEPVAGGAALLRGPLVFSLNIRADRAAFPNRSGPHPDFPNWELRPAGPWNYALELPRPEGVKRVKVEAGAPDRFPWTPADSPVVLRVPARRVPYWTLTADGGTPDLPASPVEVEPETEWIAMIPLGATQLRQTIFPVVDSE